MPWGVQQRWHTADNVCQGRESYVYLESDNYVSDYRDDASCRNGDGNAERRTVCRLRIQHDGDRLCTVNRDDLVEVVSMKFKLDEGAFEPLRAHDTDAGIDIRAMHETVVPAHGSARIETGVHVALPHGCCGMLMSKSGLNVKNCITSTGLIDEGYDGAIVVKLINHGNETYKVNAGDKVTQMVVVPVLYESIEIVDDLEQVSKRGSNGFGSSGK